MVVKAIPQFRPITFGCSKKLLIWSLRFKIRKKTLSRSIPFAIKRILWISGKVRHYQQLTRLVPIVLEPRFNTWWRQFTPNNKTIVASVVHYIVPFFDISFHFSMVITTSVFDSVATCGLGWSTDTTPDVIAAVSVSSGMETDRTATALIK